MLRAAAEANHGRRKMVTNKALWAAVGVAGLGFSAAIPSLAQARDAAAITDFSAQTKLYRQSAPARVNVVHTPHVNVVRTPRVNTVRSTTQFRSSHTVNQSQYRKLNVTGPSGGGAKFKKTLGPVGGSKLVSPAVVGPANFGSKLKVGPGKINPGLAKPMNFPIVKLGNNKIAPIWKGPKKIWWGGKWKVFVPFTAVGAVLIGGGYFYPDAYVGLAGPACVGITPDGCRLNWQMVNFEDGGSDWQCVQFCPRPGAIPPPQATALVAPPAAPQGRCEVEIFAEPNFGGNGVPTGEEQPKLSESGWQNQIASLQVRAGTWDFYTEENFAGEAMRLPAGSYPTLTPEWNKRIGSFMCVQPGG
jgi:beta/gamma crystallin